MPPYSKELPTGALVRARSQVQLCASIDTHNIAHPWLTLSLHDLVDSSRRQRLLLRSESCERKECESTVLDSDCARISL